MIEKYYFLFRKTPLVILAYSELDALEPWNRVNNRKYSIDEFRAKRITDLNFSPKLVLTGKGILYSEIKQYYRGKLPDHMVKEDSPKHISQEVKKEVISFEPVQTKRGRGRPRKSPTISLKQEVSYKVVGNETVDMLDPENESDFYVETL